MRASVFLLGISVVASATAIGDDAAAQSTPATEHFNEASSLFKRGEIALACRAFEQSYREDAAPGTLFNMGVCHEAEGRLADAYRELDLLARRAEALGRKDQAATVRARATAIQPRLARIDLVHLPARRAEVTGVLLDGSPVLPEDWDRPLYVAPRIHTLHFRYGDSADVEKKTSALAAGSTTQVVMDQPAPERASPAVIVTPAAAAPVTPASSGRQTAAYATGGAGVALLAAGAVFGVRAFAQKHDADGTCPSSGCTTSKQQGNAYGELSDARRDATLSTVGIAVGGAALVGGLVLFFTSRHADAPSAAPAQSSWTLLPDGQARGAGLKIEASF